MIDFIDQQGWNQAQSQGWRWLINLSEDFEVCRKEVGAAVAEYAGRLTFGTFFCNNNPLQGDLLAGMAIYVCDTDELIGELYAGLLDFERTSEREVSL